MKASKVTYIDRGNRKRKDCNYTKSQKEKKYFN